MGRPGRKWYVDFFRTGFYYRTYAPMGHFERTEQEVDFIVEALGLPRVWAGLKPCSYNLGLRLSRPAALLLGGSGRGGTGRPRRG